MNRYWISFLFVLIGCVGGCTNTKSVFLLFPEGNGLTEISPGIFIDDLASVQEKNQLNDFVVKAKGAIAKRYGSVESTPTIHACLTELCYHRFGGSSEIAKVFGDHILLSPRGFSWHFVAHEWSHAEMRKRLTIRAWLKLPQWFDDGVAVVVSEAPEHSVEHFKYLQSKGINVPSQEELYTFESLSQWVDAIIKYGDNLNPVRRKNGEEEYHVLYSSVANEVAPWVEKNGVNGLQNLIERLNANETFSAVYKSQQ